MQYGIYSRVITYLGKTIEIFNTYLGTYLILLWYLDIEYILIWQKWYIVHFRIRFAKVQFKIKIVDFFIYFIDSMSFFFKTFEIFFQYTGNSFSLKVLRVIFFFRFVRSKILWFLVIHWVFKYIYNISQEGFY